MSARLLIAACALFSASSAQAKEAVSAVFCRGGGEGREMRLFAAKRAANGDLNFGLTVWEANGQNFSVFGAAKPARAGWTYEEREGKPAKLVCRLQIDWRGSQSVHVSGDGRADCEANAGYGFGPKSVSFTSADFRGPVTNQLADSETFMNASCPLRHGKRG